MRLSKRSSCGYLQHLGMALGRWRLGGWCGGSWSGGGLLTLLVASHPCVNLLSVPNGAFVRQLEGGGEFAAFHPAPDCAFVDGKNVAQDVLHAVACGRCGRRGHGSMPFSVLLRLRLQALARLFHRLPNNSNPTGGNAILGSDVPPIFTKEPTQPVPRSWFDKLIKICCTPLHCMALHGCRWPCLQYQIASTICL